MNEQRIEDSKGEFEFSLDGKSYDGIELSDDVYNLAKSELELINKAEGVAESPLFTPLRPEFINDYSQFRPRSHYAKNDILKSYFIAMMWYGRMGFNLKSKELTRDALIITGQINNLEADGEKISKMWSDMMAVIGFFVGEVDDLTAYQFSNVIREIYGENVNEEALSDDILLDKFIDTAVSELPPPKIISEVVAEFDNLGERKEFLKKLMQFRFMGQRFTPDAYIFTNLTQGIGDPDKETGQMLPSMPAALMPIHLLNAENQVVKKYLDEWVNDPLRIEKQDRVSDKIIAKKINILKNEFSSYDENVWTQNIYWSWLNCFKPLLSKYGEGYPFFMRTEEWMKKNLGTVLGSYTELKHDTLLYAKQSYAELGGGGAEEKELPPVVKGYVEPDLEFWNRIIALAKTTKKGLEAMEVLPVEFKGKYDEFIEMTEFFKGIAEKELQNKEITEEEFEKLRRISGTMSRIVSPILGQELTEKEKRAGIIADIHTDALQGEILYEATGKPFIVYVAVKDKNGARLTRGAAYSHYEFAGALDRRLSDEDWQKKVYLGEGELPEGDEWAGATD